MKTYHLTQTHNLVETLTTDETITYKGHLKALNKNSLTYTIKSKNNVPLAENHDITLNGQWHVTNQNKLIFFIKHNKTKTSTLHFKQTWAIDNQHRLSYSYTTAEKKPIKHSLTLKGYWKIENEYRLYYNLDNTTKLTLNAGISQLEKNKLIYKFKLGYKPIEHTIQFDGQWQLNKYLKATFKTTHQIIQIGTIINVNNDHTLTLKISAKKWIVRLAQNKKSNAYQWYLALEKTQTDAKIKGGLTIDI